MIPDESALLVATITIRRTATAEDLIDAVTAEDAYGKVLPLAEALGMLRLAEHTLIQSRDQMEEGR